MECHREWAQHCCCPDMQAPANHALAAADGEHHPSIACRVVGDGGAEGGDPAWLERSLYALSTVETLADRSVRALHKLVFPDAAVAAAAAAASCRGGEVGGGGGSGVGGDVEPPVNSAMHDLYKQGPLSRARRQHAAACASGARAGAISTIALCVLDFASLCALIGLTWSSACLSSARKAEVRRTDASVGRWCKRRAQAQLIADV